MQVNPYQFRYGFTCVDINEDFELTIALEIVKYNISSIAHLLLF